VTTGAPNDLDDLLPDRPIDGLSEHVAESQTDD